MKKEDFPHFVNSQGFSGDSDYAAWLQEVKTRYLRIRSRIALQANYGALEFNWLLGRDIVQKNAIMRWGDKVVEQLSLDLREAFPEVKGFSARNLYYMKRWYEFYCEGEGKREILHQLGAEIVSVARSHEIIDAGGMPPIFGVVPWKHHVYIFSKCRSIEEAFYYISRTIDEGLSRKELEDIVDNDSYSKQGRALTNFDRLLPEQQGNLAMNVLKDPYNLDFLTLEKGYNERDLENALAKEITRFLLELGSGFSYIGRQRELVVSCDGYFPDLLFYHIKLRCYVVVELKVVDFMPEFAGKLNFYVAACNRLLRGEGDNPTIGLLICKAKDQTKVEWAFDSIQNPLGVATYEGIKIADKLPSVEELQKRIQLLERMLH